MSNPPTLAALARAFLRHANLTFGGGSATIAVLREELVTRRRWIPIEDVDLAFALSRVTPGTNLLAFHAAIGWLLRGFPGAVVTLVAGSVPCSALAVALTACYESWSQDALVRIALRGALAAAVGVMIATGFTLIRPYRAQAGRAELLVFVVGAFAASWAGGAPPLAVLAVAALGGALMPETRPPEEPR